MSAAVIQIVVPYRPGFQFLGEPGPRSTTQTLHWPVEKMQRPKAGPLRLARHAGNGVWVLWCKGQVIKEEATLVQSSLQWGFESSKAKRRDM